MALTLRLTAEDEKILDELTEIENASRQETIVRAIRDTLARVKHQRKVRSASKAARERYADVLDRLGN